MLTLVTGATGLVGNNVVRHLLARGDRVRVLVRESSDPRPLAGLDVEIVRGDIRDSVAVRRAIHGVARVIHSAAFVQIGWTGLETARAINVEGTRHVAEAARAEGIRMVHVSSVDALGIGSKERPADEDSPPTTGPFCPYIVTKREAEQVIFESVAAGLNATIVNPSYMVGPWDWKPSSGRMVLQVARGWALFAPRGRNNFCDVRDVAVGILVAAEHGVVGRRYILGGETLTYFQFWRIIAQETGAMRPRLPAGPLLRLVAGSCGDLWTRLSGHEPVVNSAAVMVAGQQRYFSTARAQAELAYQARPVREGVRDAWAWFKQYGYV